MLMIAKQINKSVPVKMGDSDHFTSYIIVEPVDGVGVDEAVPNPCRSTD